MSRIRLRHTFYTLFRDSPVGQLLYHLSGRRRFRPRIEHPDYVIDKRYYDFGTSSLADPEKTIEHQTRSGAGSSSISGTENDTTEDGMAKDEAGLSSGSAHTSAQEAPLDSGSISSAKPTTPASVWDDKIYVDWDGPDDPDNPKNWPFLKKVVYTALLALCTTSLYMGSAIVSPATPKLMEHFHTTETKVQLGITLFVWGYGISALCFGPMSETPYFRGRNHIYMFAEFVYSCLQIPLGLTNHVASYAVLRLLSGIMASPPLCTGAASLSDVWEYPYNLFALTCWSMGAVAGPYLGPLIGAALSNHNSWRWIFWYNIIQSGSILAFMSVMFPETSEQELLTRRARSLRRVTGNPRIASRGERLLHEQSLLHIAKFISWYPIEIMMREPVLLLMNVHLGFVYSLVYIYLEAFPISLGGVFHFNSIQQGLSFLSLLAGSIVSVISYTFYLYFRLYKPMKAGKPNSPESVYVNAAILGATLLPIGLLIFGWTSTPPYWEPPVFLNIFVSIGIWLMFQNYISYIAALYPARIASAVASNTIVRCLMSGAFPLFATVMYKHTAIAKFPVGWGCTILGFSAIIMILLPIFLRWKGAWLRERSLKKYGALH